MGLQLLARKQFLPNFQGMTIKTYVDCIAGKTHKIAIYSHLPSRKSNILDLIHIDVYFVQEKILKALSTS